MAMFMSKIYIIMKYNEFGWTNACWYIKVIVHKSI